MTVAPVLELNAKNNITPVLGSIERELQKFGASVQSNTRGIRKLENGFENMALKASKLEGNMGVLADSLIEFAPGGLPVLLAVGGIALLVKYFQDLEKAETDAAKSAKDLQYSLLEALQGADAVAKAKYIDSLDKVKKTTEDLRKLQTDAAKADREALGRAQARVGSAAQPISTIDKKKEAELKKAATDALNETVQLGIRVTDNDKRTKDKLTKNAEVAGKEAKALLEKEIKERDDFYKYAADQRIKFEEDLQKTIDAIISDAQEKRKLEAAATAKRTQNLLTSLKVPTTVEFGDQLKDQFSGPAFTAQMKELGKATTKIGNSLPTTFGEVFTNAIEPLTQLNLKARDLNSTLGDLGGRTLVYLQDGLSDAFQAIGGGANVFDELGKAAKRSVAQAAAVEGQLAFGRGLAEIAKAFSGNPVSAAMAAKHFAAGAFLSSLAGALGGGGGGGGGRGGSGGRGGMGGAGGVNNSSLGRSSAAGQGTVTINITGGGILDMNNIDTQRSFIRALESVTNKRAVVLGV